MQSVGYVFDPYMTRHENPYGDHDEAPERILYIFNEFQKRNLIQKMTAIKSRSVTREELLTVHGKEYIDKLYNMFQKYKTDKSIHKSLQEYNSIYANQQSLKCAELSAGSSIAIVEAMLDGEIDRGVAIVRPPGHHGGKNQANGFCFFNNVALAAMKAMEQGKKVAIVDFDIHHGQGTEEAVIGKKDLLFISVHRYDNGMFFPGTGAPSKEPNVLNIPLNGSEGTDEVYDKIFKEQVIPRLRKFNPDMIIVSAGFDAGEHDPLGGYKVTPSGFRNMVEQMVAVNSSICLVLEGGYNLHTISHSMAECTEALLGKKFDLGGLLKKSSFLNK